MVWRPWFVVLSLMAFMFPRAVSSASAAVRKEAHMKTRRLVWFSLLVMVLWTGLGWAEQPRYGGTLRIAWPGDPAFFNANQGPAQGAPAAWLVHNMGHSAAACTPSHRK